MRNVMELKDNWMFVKEAENAADAASKKGTAVSLPHTWNAVDGQDGGNDYHRGTCWYVTKFQKPELEAGSQVYVEFLGASVIADVYLNGEAVAHHEGGYSTFRVNLTDKLQEENVLAVALNNADNNYVYPQKADFTFYGGLYRDVNVISVPETHFELDYAGGNGIAVTPTVECDENRVPTGKASVKVETWVTGNADSVVITITGEESESKTVSVVDGHAEATFELEHVHLWDGVDDPYLYHAKAELSSGDVTETTFGCRSFYTDPEKGFVLNGRVYPLRGVSRHQDRTGAGNALSYEMHKEDMEIIKEIGANTIRLAHYQHAQEFYDLCDEYGMVVWAEIPYITMHMPNGRANTLSQMEELVVQNYNHPSIVCWGLSNEITAATPVDEDLLENHRLLNDLCHKLDKTRFTTMANVFMQETDSPLLEIPDVNSYNLYFGWYLGELEQNDEFFDEYHAKYPDRCIGFSEYGADANPQYQSTNPTHGDYSETYQTVYHEHMLKMIEERPYLWATHVWNMFDFGCAARDEGGVAGRNNKGLMTLDRKVKKDSYYIYQAYWNKKPMVHLCGKRYAQRAGETTEIRVYSNQPSVTLFLNGEKVEELSAEKVFVFTVALKDGFNILTAQAGDIKDTMTLEKVEKEPEIYVLPEVNERAEGVANWFSTVGDMDLKAPMEFPEGMYSIKDSLEELAKCPEAIEIAAKAVKLTMNMVVSPGEGMWDMMKGMSLERLGEMAGSLAPEGFIESLNGKLIQIKKV